MKTAIVADSTICPTKEQQEKYQFEIVPLNVQMEGKVFRDGVDLSAAQAYQFLDKNPEDWATSAPSPGDFLSAFKRTAGKGAKGIICLTLSQKISATWNSARMAKESAKNELPGTKIEVIDTETAAGGENLLCQFAAREVEKGNKITELVPLLEKLKKNINLFMILETIRYIYRSGRIPEVASKIGAILPLKPTLTISAGSVHFAGATTSKTKSIDKVLKILKESWDEILPDICLMHADCLSEAEKLKQKVQNLLPSAQIFITEFSPIMGYATGRGSLLIAFFGK